MVVLCSILFVELLFADSTFTLKKHLWMRYDSNYSKLYFWLISNISTMMISRHLKKYMRSLVGANSECFYSYKGLKSFWNLIYKKDLTNTREGTRELLRETLSNFDNLQWILIIFEPIIRLKEKIPKQFNPLLISSFMKTYKQKIIFTLCWQEANVKGK